MSRRQLALALADLAREKIAEELRVRYDATADAGAPTTVADGLHLVVPTADEIRAAVELATPAAPTVDVSELRSAARHALDRTGRLLLVLHASDLTVPNGYLPQLGPDTAAVNIGQAVAVVDGRAIGHLLLCDGRLGPGERATAGYVPIFDTVTNVWVAHRHRRAGVARALLEHARAQYPLVELQRPFTAAGTAWAAACAADLLGVGRNSRCPCGSGVKFKRCCLGRAA